MTHDRRAFVTGLASAAASTLVAPWLAPALAAPGAASPPPRPGPACPGLPPSARGSVSRTRRGTGTAHRRSPRLAQPRGRPPWRRGPAPPVSQASATVTPPALGARFPDLRRRFVFEYYPWYDTDPWYHWNDDDHTPPIDVTASSMPRLGPYDTYDVRVLEQHARWMAEAGVGAINLSWWGRGDYTDLAVPRVMDVMRDHDIKVTFHLEPYRDDRSRTYADDVLFLLREYGEKRRWDAFLLLDEGNGRVAPVFKSFRTILPSEVRDCLGRIFAVPDYTTDADWRRQTDTAREETRRDVSRLYLLADSLDVGRTGASGFDGLAVYDNFVTPPQWTRIAQDAIDVGLLYSFNVNPGFDRYPERRPPPPPEVDPCYGGPLGFEPGGTHPDWADRQARIAAQDTGARSRHRVVPGDDVGAAAVGLDRTTRAASSSRTSIRSTSGTRARSSNPRRTTPT